MQRIESVTLRNFRGVREGEVKGFADVTVLVGRNNSGKSTVAEAITRAAALTSQLFADLLQRDRIQLWAEYRAEYRGAAPDTWASHVWHRGERAVPIEVNVKGTSSTRNSWRWTFSFAAGNVKVQPIEPTDPAFPFARNLTVFRPGDLQDRSVERTLWPDLLSTRADKKLIAAINEIFGLTIEQIQLLPDGRLMLLLADYGLPADTFGDGTRAALRCLMTLAAMRGSMLILEEPESPQHPASLERFARTLCTFAKEREVQLLITTHSAECVRAFSHASEAASSEFAVLHLKLEDGQLSSRALDRAAFERLEESGINVRRLDLYV